MKCSIKDCENNSYAKGYCQKHYHRLWKYSTPFPVGRTVPEEKKKHLGAYNSWKSMKNRCSNKNDEYYGGAGIGVCDRWLAENGFRNFLADMGDRPVGKTLDRIDPTRGYSKENCRWADLSTQMYNRRKTNNISGETGITICRDKKGNKCLRAYINKGGKNYRAYFNIKDKKSALQWRKEMEIKLYGFAPGGIMIK